MKRTTRRPQKHLSFSVILLSIIILMAGLTGCDRRKPIKVGFVGCLTGRLSDLGISGRDGAMLAVEEINKAGGIKGRPVELIVKNDKQDQEVAIKVDRELIKEGVAAIIGHMTSAMSMAAQPLINREKILMLGPTTSTNKLTGIDDYFLRVIPPNKAETDHLAHHAFHRMGIRKMAAVYDLSNRVYTEGFTRNFKSEFEKLGGEIIHKETFTSGSEVNFVDLAHSLFKPGLDGLLTVAGALDTAMICQHMQMIGSKLPVISCGWAKTNDLLQHGGPAVEGIIFSQLFDKESQDEVYVGFKRKFKARFGSDPDFAAAHGYEAAHVLFDALSKNADPKNLKHTILEQKVFQGVQGNFKIDKYGDPKRKRYLITVKEGKFKTLE